MVRLEPRRQHSQAMVYLSPVLATLMTLIVGGIIFSFMGKNPFDALYTFFILPINNSYGISELFVKATPLVIIAIGLSMGFRANVWNIGAEGQLTMGAIFGGGLALYFYDSESMFLLPAMFVLGAIGGAFWGGIPALLRTRFNANEILTSLMLTYVATLFLSFLVHGPWRNPEGFNFPESRPFPDAGLLPVIYDGTRVHLGTAFAVLVVIAGWILLSKSVIGFQLRVVGKAPQAAPPCRVPPETHGLVYPVAGRRTFRSCRFVRGCRADWPVAACHIARLRLYRNYCCLPWTVASAGYPVWRADYGADISGWGIGPDYVGAAKCGDRPVSGDFAVLPAGL